MSRAYPRVLPQYAVSDAMLSGAPDCRLEAQYAHQQEVDMIPLMVEKGCKYQTSFYLCFQDLFLTDCLWRLQIKPPAGSDYFWARDCTHSEECVCKIKFPFST